MSISFISNLLERSIYYKFTLKSEVLFVLLVHVRIFLYLCAFFVFQQDSEIIMDNNIKI